MTFVQSSRGLDNRSSLFQLKIIDKLFLTGKKMKMRRCLV
ncbi:uncharacterized protein METZ01_LOCUS335127, partial [marine metagenome]